MDKHKIDKLLFDFLETAYLFEKNEEKRFNVSWQDIYAIQLLLKKGSMNLGQFGKLLCLEKYQASRLASRLETLAYIQRRQNTTDKRIWEISVTEKGKQKIREIEDFHYHLFLDELHGMDTQQLKGMHKLITAFSNILERKGLG